MPQKLDLIPFEPMPTVTRNPQLDIQPFGQPSIYTPPPITSGGPGYFPPSTPQQRAQSSIPDPIGQSFLPNRTTATGPDDYLGRFSDWTYKNIAQPTFSPLGIATLPLTALRAGRAGLAAIGAGMGGYGLTQSVPAAIEDPSMENILDVGLHGTMAASPWLMARAGAFAPDEPRRPWPTPVNQHEPLVPPKQLKPAIFEAEFVEDFGPPPPPRTPRPTPVDAAFTETPSIDFGGASVGTKPRVITIKKPTAELIDYWRGQGYVPIQGLRSPDGYPQMVRGDLAGLYTNAETRPPVETGAPAEEMERAQSVATPMEPDSLLSHVFGEGNIGVTDTQNELVIPADVTLTHQYLENMRENGWTYSGITKEGAKLFKRLAGEESGTFDPMEMWRNLKRLLGRDPTPQEVEQGMSRQVRPNEPTGAVAPFPSRATNLYDITQELRQPTNNGEATLERAQQIIDGYTRSSQARTDYIEILRELNNPTDNTHAELLQIIADFLKEKGNQLNAAETQGMGQIRPMGELRRNFIPDEPPTQMDPRMIQRVEAGGPSREFDFTQPPPQQGQLFPMEVAEPDRSMFDGDLRRIREAEAMRRITEPPSEQQLELPLRSMAPESPQEMRVPGVTGRSGLENVALGGASPRVWDVAARSLYSGSRPVIVTKELLQNAFDEHRAAGISSPVRIVFNKWNKNPRTNDDSYSVTVRDNGRGLTPEQLYTKLTDLGETGKGQDPGAAGGFGFAKAAPFGAGQYAEVISTVLEKGKRVQYSFAGSFSDLKNQVKGVEITRKVVSNDIPTGLEITTHFDKGDYGIYDAENFATNLVKSSQSLTSDVLISSGYETKADTRAFLDSNGINEPVNINPTLVQRPTSMPPFRATVNTPGADVSIYYEDPPPNSQGSGYELNIMNKGLFQKTLSGSYGYNPVPNVPRSIVADIIATVEEGAEGYPFTANREQLDSKVQRAIDKWIDDNITSGAERSRVQALQKYYDDIAPLPNSKIGVHFYDEGNRFTPEEVQRFGDSPAYNEAALAIERVHNSVLLLADTLNWNILPSSRLKKFGMLFKGPDQGKTTLGIHIPRADDPSDSAILFGLMEHLNQIEGSSNPVDDFAAKALATIAHEIAHIPGGGHDTAHSYRDADLRGSLGRRNTGKLLDELAGAVGDLQNGQINPELSELLSIYNESRQRTAGTNDALLATGVSSERRTNPSGGAQGDVKGTGTGKAKPGIVEEFFTDESGTFNPVELWRNTKKATGWGQGTTKPKPQVDEYSFIREAMAVPSGITTTGDFSAPGRQGLALIDTPQWWAALPRMIGAVHYGTFKKMDAELRRNKIHRKPFNPATGTWGKSHGEQVGLKLFSPASEPGPRAEQVASRWLETGGILGPESATVKGVTIPNPFHYLWRHTVGYGIRASNRAFITFLNHLKTNRYEYLADRMRDMSLEALTSPTHRAPMQGLLGGPKLPDWMGGAQIGLKRKYTPQEALNLDPYTNLDRGKELADFINTATGQAPLKIHALPFKQTEINLEKHATALTAVAFSPGLLASRARLMWPPTYIMATPFIRRQYMRAAIAAGLAWAAFTELAKNAGGNDVEVSDNPTSSDFGKVRIGNTRFDAGGGFLQFYVQLNRFIRDGWTSTADPDQEFKRFGEGFNAETQRSVFQRFLSNKLNPVWKFAYDLADASENKPFHMHDRIAQQFIPLVIQDLIELYKEDPRLLPWMAPIMGGLGTQTYEHGEESGKIVPAEDDWLLKSGGEVFPWNRRDDQ